MLFLKVLPLLLAFSYTSATTNNVTQEHNTVDTHPNDEHILCRTCGFNVALTKHIVSNRVSPASLYTFYDNIFGKTEVVVQELPSDFIFDYPVVTFSESTCSGTGEWEESSWFPGYLERACACPICGTYLGWVFQPSDPTKKSLETFFGFIFTGVIGESCMFLYCGGPSMWIILVPILKNSPLLKIGSYKLFGPLPRKLELK